MIAATAMETHTLAQGSPEWHAHRLEHFNASDAPAMMGCSPYKTRTQLLDELVTGLSAEVDEATQRLFDDGHRFEYLARPLAEKIIGEELYPVVGSRGRLSASFDGLTMLEAEAFEHKMLNEVLRAAMVDGCTGRDLPLYYQVQMEQQHIVSGCERILFMASQWTADGVLVEVRHCWYEPNQELAARIIAGWAQLEQDLRTHVVKPREVKPEGKAPETLPALRIEVTGAVTASNLAAFKETALAAIQSVNRDLSTDLDFANADKAVKWCSEVESRLAAAKEHALSQTASIDALFKTIDDISAEARRVRLDLEKLVKARKESIRAEIVANAQAELDAHVTALNGRLGSPWVARTAGNFAEVMKGKRTVDTLRDAATTALAELKIALTAHADRLQVNRKVLEREGRDWISLFPDFAAVGGKAAEDFAAIAELRISKQLADEAAAAERQRAAEEAARAAVAVAATPVAADAPKEAPVAGYAESMQRTFLPAPVSVAVAEMPSAVDDDGRRWKLGEVSELFGKGGVKLGLTADLIRALGVEPARSGGAAQELRTSQVLQLRANLVAHLLAVEVS